MNHPVVRNQNGVALVLVLWAVVFLAVLVSNFSSSMRVQAKITRNYVDQTRAYYLARTGIELGLARIVQRLQYIRRHGHRNPDEREGGAEEPEGPLWRVDGTANEVPWEQGKVRVYITLEEGKVDLNRSNTAILRNLLKQWDLEDKRVNVIVDSVADWRDGDKLHRANGAEDDYYQSLQPPYRAKNGDFTSVEELLRVRGMDPDLLFGLRPLNEENSSTVKQGGEYLPSRLIDCLTVYNRDGRINLSYAPREVLEAIPFMTPSLAERILELRDEVGSENLTKDQVRQALGDEIYNAVKSYIKVGEHLQSRYFSVISEGELDNGFVLKIKALATISARGDSPVKILQWIDWVS